MKRRIAIIDGYNVIYKDAGLQKRMDVSLASARDGLIEYCTRWLSTRGDFIEFWIVFDGDSSVMPSSTSGVRGVRVIFTRTKEDADDRILSLLKEASDGSDFVVISSDNYVSGNAKRHGASIMQVSDFFGTLGVGKRSSIKRNRSDGDTDRLSPVEERKINESLKKEWGLE